MAEKKSFLLYLDYKQHLQLLSDEERGKLLMALFDYASQGTISQLDGMGQMAFSFIKAQMDRDSKKYEAICNRNKENGSKGGRPAKAKNREEPTKPTGLFGNPSDPKKAETGTDNGITPIAPKGATHSDYDSRFQQFWKAYPKKVGKGAAERSFKKYKPDDMLLSVMLKAIVNQKNTEGWTKDSGRFIPNPSTWLNQRRWEDEMPDSNSGYNTSPPADDNWKGLPRL